VFKISSEQHKASQHTIDGAESKSQKLSDIQSMASSTKPACAQVFCCVRILNLLLEEYLA
jgi:hypothetical protein